MLTVASLPSEQGVAGGRRVTCVIDGVNNTHNGGDVEPVVLLLSASGLGDKPPKEISKTQFLPLLAAGPERPTLTSGLREGMDFPARVSSMELELRIRQMDSRSRDTGIYSVHL